MQKNDEITMQTQNLILAKASEENTPLFLEEKEQSFCYYCSILSIIS